jgi:hypothetical protein
MLIISKGEAVSGVVCFIRPSSHRICLIKEVVEYVAFDHSSTLPFLGQTDR